jgi:hypothetical protein
MHIPIRLDAFEEAADSGVEHAGNIEEPSRAHAVCSGFVLLDLLVGDPQSLRQLILSETQHRPAFADLLAYMLVHAPRYTSGLFARLFHCLHP